MVVKSNIDPTFPRPNVDQPSQGFRNNFAAAKREIENLQGKTITLVGAITGGPVMIDSGPDPITLVTVGKSYTMPFTNSSLLANVLTVSHNLNQQYVSVTVWDNLNRIATPTVITATSSSDLTVDLTGLTPITGTWHVFVRG